MYDNNIENIKKAKLGNNDAMTELINDNNGLIWSIVKRFLSRGYEAEDLYQIGCIGFIKSIKRFETDYDVKLSTYAVPYILGEIKKFIRDDGIIKISRSIKELNAKIIKLEEEYLRKTGKNITISEIEKTLKVDNNSGDDKGIDLINKIPAQENEENTIVDKITINELIRNLEPKERQIIVLRFYKNKTQNEVGKMLGISQVQVSRIEKSILNKMKMNLEAI